MTQLRYYTRRGCHLCEVMLEELLPLLRRCGEIELCDVDSDPAWLKKYDIRVPVLEVDGQVISEYPLDREAIDRFLAELPGVKG